MEQLHGVITIKKGLVTHVKNVTDFNAAVVADGDPARVLKELSDAGWQLCGDYQLKIQKAVETDESRMAQYVSESKSSKPPITVKAYRPNSPKR